MKERPILFSGAMVRALLAGTKTQTRRVMKPQPTGFVGGPGVKLRDGSPAPLVPIDEDVAPVGREIRCPYGAAGDRLWVRESFCHLYRDNTEPPARRPEDVAYMADGITPDLYAYGPWKPSIHMPRWASRITLVVTGVRVERLQDISKADALAEGVNVHQDHHGKPTTSIYSPVQAYRDLWEQINGPGSWDANPWVWAVDFKRLEAAA